MRLEVKKQSSLILLASCWMLLSSRAIATPSESAKLSQEVERLTALVEQLQKRVSELELRLDETDGMAPQAAAVRKVVAPTPPAPSPQWKAYWENGLRVESADKFFGVKMGGRIMYDFAFFGQNDGITDRFGLLADGNEFRRSRLFVSGLLHRQVEFKAQYDFAGGQSAVKDVYVGVVKIPVLGGFRVGHFKEPFSLETHTSSKYITFMERSLPNVFGPERSGGAALHNQVLQNRLTWALGAFRDTDPFGDRSGGKFHFTGRLTGLPWYQDGGEKLLHLGLGYSRRRFDGESISISQRPEAHLAPKLVNTGGFVAAAADLLGVEAALVYGPVSLQTEYIRSDLAAPAASNPNLHGFYLQGSVFLTGEHRRYDTRGGGFGRVRPKRNLFKATGGPGAWEAAIRYSQLDLDNGALTGGELENLTLGLNWYLNPITRVMWNYVRSEREDVGEVDIFQMRFQIDF